MKKIRLLLVLALASVCSIQVMRAEVDVTTLYLQNASLMSLDGWSYGDNGHNYTDWRTDGAVPVIEHWNSTKTFHLTQEATLPAGAYRFSVNAFYREGDGNGTNNKAYMVVGENTKFVHALTPADVTFNETLSGSSAFLRAATAFSLGYYNNTLDFTLDDEQTITLGVRGTITTSNSWFVHGPFKLYQLTLDDFLSEYRVEVANAEALYGKPMSAVVLAELQAAVVAESNLTTSAMAVQATATLQAAIAKAKASVLGYISLLNAINHAKAYAVKCYANGAPESDALDAYETAYNNRTVLDSEVDAKIAEINEIMKAIGLSQSSWQRLAPVMPRTLGLESGKIYYLYNVGSDRFLSFDPSTNHGYPLACSDQGQAVRVNLVNGTQYNIIFVNGTRYWYSNSTDLYSFTGTYSGDYIRFTLTEVEGGYTIQRVYDSNQDLFIGFDGRNGNRLYTDLTEGNIIWQLMDAEEAARYIAQRNLYRALEAADGYVTDKWDFVYDNDASSNYALQEAADVLYKAVYASNAIQKPDWSDYNILFDMDVVEPWYYISSSDYFQCRSIANGSRVLNATFEVDDDATLVYSYSRSSNWGEMEVYLDDALYQLIESEEGELDQRYFVEMGAGKHTITWKYVNYTTSSSLCFISCIGIEKTPTMEVSLLEPGSIGTEVLKQTDHIQNVRKLVVNGPMNDDDWDRIMMMTSLFSIDLTNAEITEIPQEQLSRTYNRDNLSFFHEVKLPKTLKTIGKKAFYGSFIDDISFPDGLQTIGQYAFRETRIKEAIMPETVTLIGVGAFMSNESLKTVSYPAAAQSVPDFCFHDCPKLQPFGIPEGIISIGNSAFYQCYRYNTNIPASVSSIGTYAFNNCNLDNVVLSENINVGNEAFEYCKLKTIEFPTSMYSAPSRAVKYCTNMTDLYLKSPTMVSPNDLIQGCNNNLTIHVPDYLVNTYKQDAYWYNFEIVGFSTADVTDWYVKQPLKMSAGERFEGTPNVKINEAGTWQISGDDAMMLNNFETDFYNDWNGFVENKTTQILSTCDNIQITGEYTHWILTEEKRWYFVTLPFDTKVGDITSSSSFAIRYYDGANRAENGSGGNWKNYSKDNIIPAGTGFIFQTSKNVWSGFKAQNNASKQYVFQNKEFVKALSANDSESAANKGWNLVGNPWMCYYNIHKVNFTAPITVWNVGNRNYSAYSIIDDDYAIKPNEAFFVQCPDEVNSISFPIDGRQLTSVIESQNGVKSFAPQEQSRWLIDVVLSDGELNDKTRFVLNEQASLDYEVTCDASKFFSMDNAVPQIYTIEESNQLAINERPMGDGIVKLGMKIASNGSYTISAPRNQFREIVLVDLETGAETNLRADSYTFTADAGTTEGRFELRLNNNSIVTSIDEAKAEEFGKTHAVYTLDGRQMTSPMRKGIYVVDGKKVIVK